MKNLNKRMLAILVLGLFVFIPFKVRSQFLESSDIMDNDKYETGKLGKDSFWFTKKGERKYGIIKDAKVLIPNIFNEGYYAGLSVSDNENVILILGSTSGLYNVVLEKWEIPLEYETLSKIGYSNRLYSARKSGKQGLIDVDGDVVIDFNWDRIQRIPNIRDYFFVKNKRVGYNSYKSGIYNILTKSLIVPCEFNELSKIYSRNLFKVKKNGVYNVLSIKNELQFKEWYDELIYIDEGRGCFIVEQNNKMGVVDMDNKAIVPIRYELISNRAFTDGSRVSKNEEGKFGCLRVDGVVTLPFIYDDLQEPDDNGIIVSTKGGEFGMIKVNSGVPYELVACNYDNIEPQRKIYIVQQKGKYTILDKFGKSVNALEYDNVKTLKKGDYYGEGLFLGEKDGNKILLNDFGSRVTGSGYKEISVVSSMLSTITYYSFETPFNYLKYKRGTKYGLIYPTGVVVLKPKFDDILHEKDKIFITKLKDKMGLYDLTKSEQIVNHEYDNIVASKDGFLALKGSKYFKIEVKDSGVEMTEY